MSEKEAVVGTRSTSSVSDVTAEYSEAQDRRSSSPNEKESEAPAKLESQSFEPEKSYGKLVPTTTEQLKYLTDRFDPSFTDEDQEIIAAHLGDRSVEESIKIIQEAVIRHDSDPALESAKIELLDRLTRGPLDNQPKDEWEETLKFEAFIIHEWSIYPEVRAATRPIEEREEYCETLRVYILAATYSMAGSCLTTFFDNRFPSIKITTGAIQLLLLGTGRLWARLPVCSVPVGFGKRLAINPGPWTFKEQMLATLAVSVSLGSPYSISTITAQVNENFFGFTGFSYGYVVVFTLSSQIMGFGVAGIMRSFLVYPETCIWYSMLPTIVLNRALIRSETRENINGWKLLRWETFAIFATFSFVWYWVTNFLFEALSMFDWPAWIAPNNVNLQAICGGETGMGLNPIPTFDWNNMDRKGMITPFYAAANQFFGIMLSFVAIVIMWYTNTSNAAYMPINSNSLWANDGKKYVVSKVLDDNGQLDVEKYQSYSLPFYSAANLSFYGAYFIIYPAMFVYALLNYSKLIYKSLRTFFRSLLHPGTALYQHNDRFTRSMRKYKEVPEWWFLIVLLASFALAIVTVKVYTFTHTPVWTIVLGVVISVVFTIPFGILYATTNLQIEVNVLIELIIGYALPGNGSALMISKTYATQFNEQTDGYIANQAAAHYTEIPPRSLFRVQILTVILVSMVQTGIIYWQMNGGIVGMCDSDNSLKYTCQGARTFFNAAVIWGTLGPKRVFSGLYPHMKYCFLLGALFPLPFWVLRKYGPRVHPIFNKMKNVNEILWVQGCMNWAPYNLTYYWPNFLLSFIFNFVIKRKYPVWWKKYNYIIWVAMGVGVAWSALIMFFSTSYHHVVSIDWWGNTVYKHTLDDSYGGYARHLPIPASGYFGPAPGTFP